MLGQSRIFGKTFRRTTTARPIVQPPTHIVQGKRGAASPQPEHAPAQHKRRKAQTGYTVALESQSVRAFLESRAAYFAAVDSVQLESDTEPSDPPLWPLLVEKDGQSTAVRRRTADCAESHASSAVGQRGICNERRPMSACDSLPPTEPASPAPTEAGSLAPTERSEQQSPMLLPSEKPASAAVAMSTGPLGRRWPVTANGQQTEATVLTRRRSRQPADDTTAGAAGSDITSRICIGDAEPPTGLANHGADATRCAAEDAGDEAHRSLREPELEARATELSVYERLFAHARAVDNAAERELPAGYSFKGCRSWQQPGLKALMAQFSAEDAERIAAAVSSDVVLGSNERIVLLMRGDDAVGYAYGAERISGNCLDGPRLHHLFIQRPFRGTGLGQKLLLHWCEETPAEFRAFSVNSPNQHMRRVLRRLGSKHLSGEDETDNCSQTFAYFVLRASSSGHSQPPIPNVSV